MGGVLAAVLFLRFGYALLARVHQEADFQVLAGRIFRFGLVPRGVVKDEVGPSAWSFAGRAGRAEWVVSVVIAALIGSLLGMVPTYGALLGLPWTLATLAVTSRRLHDLGQSGWLQVINVVLTGFLIFQFKPELSSEFWAFSKSMGEDNIALLSLITGAVLVIFNVALALLPGNAYSNCYGEATQRRRRLI